MAGDVSFSSAVGMAAINGKLAGADIAIISSLTNTLPYYIIGRPEIASPEALKGKTAAVHIPGTAADFALRLALKGVGLSLRDIKTVTVGGGPARIAAVMSGQVDFTVRRMVRAMAEGVYYYKTHRDEVISIMQKYTRGMNRAFLEEAYAAYRGLLVEDTYPTLEGLKNTLEIQATLDPKAAKARAEEFVDLRFVDELKKTGFVNQLYGRR
ncbi:hypothetical protein EPO44_05825 [bacterium]|nr:MAG: hypothetical protein EPO44_05825 [bacterium]